MKNNILIVLSIITFSAQAQFNLDYTYGFKAGDNIDFAQFSFDTTGVEGKSGLNQVWDFSNYIIDKKSMLNFATQNTKKNEDSDFETMDNPSIYFKSDMQGLYIVGEDQSFERSGFGTTYTPHRKVMQYPLEYDKVQNYTFKGKMIGSAVGEGAIRKGTSSVHLDGYGKVIMPDKLIYQAIRIKSESTTFDSLGNNSIIFKKEIKYSFYIENVRIPAVEIFYYNEYNWEYSLIKLYDQNKSTDFNDTQFTINPDFYPNPVEKNTGIHLIDEIQNVEIFNLTGSKIFAYNGDERYLQLNLNSGIYILKTLNNNGQIHSSKLVVK